MEQKFSTWLTYLVERSQNMHNWGFPGTICVNWSIWRPNYSAKYNQNSWTLSSLLSSISIINYQCFHSFYLFGRFDTVKHKFIYGMAISLLNWCLRYGPIIYNTANSIYYLTYILSLQQCSEKFRNDAFKIMVCYFYLTRAGCHSNTGCHRSCDNSFVFVGT